MVGKGQSDRKNAGRPGRHHLTASRVRETGGEFRSLIKCYNY